MTISLEVAAETFPVAGSFTISRGSRTEVTVVGVRLARGGFAGRAECVPYARYGETVEGVIEAIRAAVGALGDGLDRARLGEAMPAGAARNALDCALWDLEAKESGVPAFRTFGLARLDPVVTAYTLSLGTPGDMERAAAAASGRPLLKVKLGGDGDDERIDAVRRGAPDAELIVDANEAWRPDLLDRLIGAAERARVRLIEQPLPAGDDAALADCSHAVPICADESAHTGDGIDALIGRYDAINVKLDKTGGVTEAKRVVAAARERDMKVMIGCMLGTSLAMAPALLVAQGADFVDLDGPLLLARDREPGLVYDGSNVLPPPSELWG